MCFLVLALATYSQDYHLEFSVKLKFFKLDNMTPLQFLKTCISFSVFLQNNMLQYYKTLDI